MVIVSETDFAFVRSYFLVVSLMGKFSIYSIFVGCNVSI